MTLHCNICEKEIDEKEIESHIRSQEHNDNKSKLHTKKNGLETSVLKVWQYSLKPID